MTALGCLCFVSTHATKKDKFDPKAEKFIFLGYLFGKKAYEVYDLSTHKISHSRDIVFYESHFPFASSPSDSSIPSSSIPFATSSPPPDEDLCASLPSSPSILATVSNPPSSSDTFNVIFDIPVVEPIKSSRPKLFPPNLMTSQVSLHLFKNLLLLLLYGQLLHILYMIMFLMIMFLHPINPLLATFLLFLNHLPIPKLSRILCGVKLWLVNLRH